MINTTENVQLYNVNFRKEHSSLKPMTQQLNSRVFYQLHSRLKLFIHKATLRGKTPLDVGNHCVCVLCFRLLLGANFVSCLCNSCYSCHYLECHSNHCTDRKMKFPLPHDKHGPALPDWSNIGLGSPNVLSKHMRFLTLTAHNMPGRDRTDLLFRTQYLCTATVPTSLQRALLFPLHS